MSTNSTVIPGLQQPMGSNPSRPIQPGMPNMPGFSPASPAVNEVKSANTQIFGFLFSVSKTLSGEFWPLYLGGNSIGRSKSCSIVLSEATVSESHADIHVISRSGSLIVYVTDSQSKTGTLLNGKLLRGEADLHNGDILTIGECYELLVLIINPVELGLAPKEGFTATESTPVVTPQAPVSPYTPGNTINVMPNPVASGVVPPFPRPAAPKGPRGGQATVVEGQAGAATPVGGQTVVMGGPFGK